MCARPRTSSQNSEKSVETVTEITLRLKGHVEKSFQNVAVQGEISGGKLWSSGHYYASLKDKGAILNLKMWSSAFQRVPFEIEEGMQLVAYGKLEVYAPRGAYSLVAERLEPLGQGALDLAFRQIFERLLAQGLFEETRKRPLPQFPRRVAVITSAAGAALRDFWRVVRDRWPLAELLVIDSLVQGDKAAAQLTAAVRMAGTLQDVDLIVLTRGGGSREDLW
ncbi:MAG: Exodeoxyribonuclease 7 large subunit, partial [Planctomycetota bacterium]